MKRNMITGDPGLYQVGDLRTYAAATGRDLHIDTALTDITLGYRPQGLIADEIFPVVSVDKQSNAYYVWTQAEWFRLRNAERAPKTRANRINFAVSSNTYFALNYALGLDIPWSDLGNADAALDIRNSAAALITDNLALNWENRLATAIVNTSNVGSNNALSNNYSNVANTTPVQDIDDGIESIRSVTGLMANLAIFSGVSWRRFRRHQDVIDYVRGKGDNVGGGGVTEVQVAAAWGFDKVKIGLGILNTAGEGAASATYTDIWSTSIVLLHVAKAPGKMIPTYGYTFRWTPAELPAPMVVRRYDIVPEMVEAVEVHQWQDERITATELGFLITGA